MLNIIDDETATRFYNEIDTSTGEDYDTKAKALAAWADAKDAKRNKQEWDHLTRVYTDFDNYISDEGYSDLDEESRYQIANRQFIANQLGETVEDQGMIYPAKRDIWTQQAFGKKGLSEKETFGLIQQGVQSRNEVIESANEIPGDIALGLFDSIGNGTAVEVPKLVSIWKERNAEKLKKLPAGWESGLLQAASDYATETEGMLRNYSEPLKQVYDHLAAVTGRDTERAGEDNPKSVQEIEALADTLATMPPDVRDRAYAAVVLGAKQAGQEPKEFLEQWGESWSRTLNMFRSGSMVMQEDAAYSELQLLKEAPKVWKENTTGKLTVYPGFDQSNFQEITPEERTQLTAEAQKKFDRLQVYRELYNIADNQFDPIKKINEGGFGGFMEAMAYGSPQALAYTGMALVPGVGPWMTGAAIYAEEYNKLRLDGVDPESARMVAAPSAILQSGLERVGAKMIFGKLPAFEKLMTKIGNPARVGRAGSAGIRLGTAVVGENIVEGTQDLVTPVVQDVAAALGADVPDVNWQETLGQWGTSRLDVLAATIPGILIGTGVATMADGKRFNDFNERLDLYRTFGMDKAAIKRVEDNQTPQDRQAALQAEYKKLTPDNIKAGISYMETKIDEAKSMQEDPTLPTMTREQGENGKPVFVVRDEKGTVAYRSEDEQSAMTAHREMLRTRITGATTGIVESLQFIDRVNQAIARGEDIQKLVLDDAPRNLLDEYEANPTEQNLDNLFQTVRAFGMDINEPSELANFPVLASNRGALAEGIYRSVIRIQDGATGIEVMRDFSQDNLKRALAEGRVSMDWVREQLNEVIPLIESERTERKLRTETDTDVIESFSDVAVAYMNGKIRDEQIPGGLRGFLRRIAVVVKDIFRRAYRLRRAISEGKVDSNFEGFLAESVGLNQQTMVDTTRERASGDIITDGGQMLMDFSIGSRTSAVSTDTPAIRASNATITGPANYSIGAFHGTPHKVDKFSLDKIGTGEGAQAYGWGLYFAQAKAVGEGYRDQLGGIRLMTADGQMADNIVSTPGAKKILKEARAFWKQTKSLDGFVKQLEASKSQSKVWAAQGDNVESNSQYVKDVDEVLSVIKDATPTQTGNLYSVELDVDDADLLDWDKPLSEQSEKVMEALAVLNGKLPNGEKITNETRGQRIYGAFVEGAFGDTEAASRRLLDFGIPGIRYLDGGSRSDGQGTYNYVIFDENLIKITEENGNRIPAAQALAAPATGATNYSIASVEHFKNDKRFDKLVKDGRVVIGHDIEEFKGMHILLHSPDNAFAGTIKLTDGEEIQGKGGVYYPALFADKNYFWASTEAMVMRSAKHLNEIGKKNNGKILMGLVSAPVEKLFSSSSMAGGVVKFLNALSSDAKGGLSKAKLNSMLVTASKVKVFKPGKGIKKFRDTLKASDGLAGNLAKMDSFLEPTGSIFEVRKMFVESLAEQLSAHLGSNSKASEYVAGILTDAENKYAKNAIKRGKLSKASILQGLGNMLTEPFLRDFQDYGNGKIYAVLEVDGMVDGVASTAHESYPFTLVPRNKKSKVKLHVLNQAVDWQDVVGKDTGQYSTPQERLNLMPTSGMSSTTLKVLGVRGGSKANPLNYSIASQREIDRVNAALGGMNRGPDERLKVYERAKQKFSKLMAWNSDELGAMADTGSDETQIRRTQLLQGMGELDAILQVLPPEVRGRVGGYTKLANIAPMDVFKDGVKISEVSGMKGALISAWMDQGLNIGQAGKKVDFPPGYTAKENLATARADKALADFFRDRIKKIDTELEKVIAREYRTAILDLVKKSRPKAGDNNVRKSTLGPETQKLADLVQRATLMDEDAVAERMLQLEQSMQSSEDNSALVEEWGILNTFGDLSNRNSDTLAQAHAWFRDQLKAGRESWRIKEEARIAENRERAKKTVEWLGKVAEADRQRNKTISERASDFANQILLDHASFEQFVSAILPPEIAADLSTRLRKADVAAQKTEIDQREGILNALRAGAKAAGTTTGKALESLKIEVPNSVRYLDGRKVKNTKLTIEQSEKIVRGEIDRGDLTDTDVRNLADELAALPADTRKENITLKQVVSPGKEVKLPMTRGKAIQYLLSWNQPDVRDKMMRTGWTEDSIIDLRNLTSDPVSQAMLSHAQELYGKGYAATNPVYARMFGMNMPQVKNYAPTRFSNAKDVKDVGLDGSPVATGTTPGFAKSRVSHSAKIAPEDALSVMQQHILAQSHWVNFAELAREFRSLITNPEVRESIKQNYGDAVLKHAEQWADQMEQRGGNQSREAAWINSILGSVIGGQSVASLGFNLKTLAMQLDNAVRFGLSLDMKQIVSAMQSPDQLIQDIKTVFESDALQTRLRGGATAETRFLFQKFGGRPGTAAKVSEASMSAINWMDSATTSFSAAIVYRANLNDALAAGMPENLARETALDAASAAIYRFAQPVSFGQKSNMENSGNMLTKAFFLFMSDPRLKTAIMADSIRGLVTGRGDKWTHIRRLVAVELMAVLSHVVASAYRDAFTDDDDEEIWSLGGWVRALALAPLQGYFIAGSVFDGVLSQLTDTGFYTPTQNPLLSVMQSGIRALKNADDILAFDDPDALLKEWVSIARMLAVTPTMAAPAVLLNTIKPIFGAVENAETPE